jgi:phosphohistidine phosphatase
LHAARWPDAGGTVLVVGHQPTLGEVASHLIGCEDTTLSIKKGSIWWFSQRDGSSQVTLRLVITPDFL